MKESAIERKLAAGVDHLGFRAYKFVSPGNSGVPDRIIVGHGLTYFVELKTDEGKLSSIQRVQILRLHRLGQTVRVLYGVDGVESFLRELQDTVGQEARPL